MSNIKVSITRPGVTTLATKDKLCDRDIDISVDDLLEAEAVKILERSITELVNSSLSVLSTRILWGAAKLRYLWCPKVTSIQEASLAYCTALETIYTPKVHTINKNSITNNAKLKALVLSEYQGVAKLSTSDAFNGSGVALGTGFVYVPDDLVESYKTATNWSKFAEQIKPASEWSGEV